MAHHLVLLWLTPFRLRIDSEGWWFEDSMSQLRICLSAEGAKNVYWPWLSPLRGWGSLTVTSSGKFVYMAHHFILLRLNLFGVCVDSEEQWFEHYMSQLRVCLQAEGAIQVSWPWLFPIRGQGSLTMTSTFKFLQRAHHFILLRLNPFGLPVDREGWWFEHSMSQLRIGFSAERAKSVSCFWLSPLRGFGSLTMTSTSKFLYMAHHFIFLQLNPFGLRFDSN